MSKPIDYNDFIKKPRSIEQDWLTQWGVPVKDSRQKYQLADKVYAELERRVGNQLADEMSDSDFHKFEAVLEKGDEEAKLNVLRQIRPDYDDVVVRHVELLGKEIRNADDKIAFINAFQP